MQIVSYRGPAHGGGVAALISQAFNLDGKAETQLKLGKLDDAISEFEQTLKIQPANDASINGLTRALYLKAQLESQESLLSNDFETAAASLDRAIKLRPNDLQLRLAQAKMNAFAGKPVDLTKIGKPANDPERLAYAEALLAQNQFSQSSEQIKEVISHRKLTKDLLTVGDLALIIKDLDGAQAAYKQASAQGASERALRGLAAVEKARAEAHRRLNLGNELARKNQLESAKDSFRQAILLDPRLAEARYGLAAAEERLSPKEPEALKDATTQYRAYLTLAEALPPKVSKKINDHAQKIETRATKIEAKEKRSPNN